MASIARITRIAAWILVLTGLFATKNSHAQSPSAPSEARAAESVVESQNRDLIVRLYFQFFNTHDITFAEKVISPTFIQHNPTIPTGRQALIDVIQGFVQGFPGVNWNIDHISAGGDLVWLQVHVTTGPHDPGTEIMDIYRIRDGIIVEHWDAGEAVSTTPANTNTQF